jgi:predicted DNA-binding transcriptional regulator AlpA
METAGSLIMGKAETASTVDELASALGVDRTTVYRWKNDWGLDDLFDETGGGWKVSEVREWAKDMKRARRAVLRPGLDIDVEEGGDSGGRDWGEVYRKAKAILATLQAKRMQESLLDRDQVEEQWASRVGELTAALESLPPQLAPMLAPVESEAEVLAILKQAFSALREHFSREE